MTITACPNSAITPLEMCRVVNKWNAAAITVLALALVASKYLLPPPLSAVKNTRHSVPIYHTSLPEKRRRGDDDDDMYIEGKKIEIGMAMMMQRNLTINADNLEAIATADKIVLFITALKQQPMHVEWTLHHFAHADVQAHVRRCE